jgi:glycosyltransferase involved in cell wall biosynthesis
MVKSTIHFLESLFEDWEILIVNDGSQDRTEEIIDHLVQHHARLVALHHHHNRGYGAALTSGIQQARKELIFFCDADLQFHPNELLLPVIRKAFAELLHLYSKLRHIRPVVAGYDRRRAQTVSGGPNHRQGERRVALLPINFSDRRCRLLQRNGSVTAMSPATYRSQVVHDA